MKAEPQGVSAGTRLVTAIAVVVPFAATVLGAFRLWGFGADVISTALCVVFCYINTLGIGIGFHRCFTHRGFTIAYPWLKYLLGICGSMAGEGSLFTWVGWHIKHHSKTDKEGDPHSPHLHSGGFWNMLRGIYHAHVGWLFVTPRENESLTKGLQRDPILLWIDRRFGMFFLIGLILPVLVGALIRHSITWVHVDFMWGSLIRLFFVHHITWSVNSICHLWGDRSFKTGDRSTNNFIVALLTSGEGNHNSHHAFPGSPKHGLLKGQPDLLWWIILLLGHLGWIKDIQVQIPTSEKIQEKRA